MNRTIYRKFSENGKCYRIQSSIGKLSLSLLILEEANKEIEAYKTPMILEQNIKKQAQKLGLTIEDYFSKLIHFLENPSNVKFTFTKNSLTVLEAVNSNLQAKYFHCDLIKITDFSSFIGNVIDDLHSQKYESENNHVNLTEKYELLKKEIIEYKNKLNDLVERKKVDDQAMLSNFVSLLNEKKRKIQHLNELLEAFRGDPSLANPVEVNVNSCRKRKRNDVKTEEQPPRVKEEVSDSDSSISNNDYNTTDSEKDEDITEVKIETKSVASQYIDDIFDESPPKIVASLPKISRESNGCATRISLPSTSKDSVVSKQHCNAEKILSVESKSLDTPVVDINTQDWLDRL